MKMTREEAAIKSCEDRLKHLESAPTHHYGKRHLYENSDWYGDYSLIEAAINRLAAYEDTGLEPEGVVHLAECWQQEHETLCQYLALGSIDRLRELAQAHKENRVLPEGSGWFVTCNGKKLTIVMDKEADHEVSE